MQVRGAHVLITGASRGIGEATAVAFADAGARVALVARTAGPLTELADRLGGTAHPTDLSDRTAVAGLVARVEAAAGPIDVLVNNAGLGDPGLFTEQTDAHDEATVAVNLLAPMSLSRQVIPGMIERGRGHIVNVSSLAGVVVFPGLVTYSTTKAALSQFTAGLRADLRGLPVGTTLVELGPVPTDMLDDVQSYAPTNDSFRRAALLQLSADVPRTTVARELVRAVQRDRAHVRLPRRSLPFAELVEAPRRIAEVLLTGIDHRER